MYEGIKKQITGPKQSKANPLKTKLSKIIKDKQMKRWVQHSDLYAWENQVSQAVLYAIENLLALYNLDTTPTKEKLKRAIGSFPSGRSPGKDAIPPCRSHQVWQYNTIGW